MWSGLLASASYYHEKVSCWIIHSLGLSLLFPSLFGPPTTEVSTQTEHFPLLSLPSEIVAHVFSFLRTADRMRARVCHDLYALEASVAYKVERMVISSNANHFFPDTRRNPMYKYIDEIQIRLAGDRSLYVDSIQKMASNVTPEILYFKCELARDLPVVAAVNEIRAELKAVVFIGPRLNDYHEVLAEFTRRTPTGDEPINDANLREWIGGDTRFFRVTGNLAVTGEGLHRLFTEMEAGGPLLTCTLSWAAFDSCKRFLELLGITKVGDRLHSTRADVEIYVERPDRYASSAVVGFHLIVVGSRMKITLSRFVLEDGPTFGPTDLSIERHNADGSVPEHWRNRYSFFLAIQDIRGAPDRLSRLPVTYGDDDQQQQQ